MKHSVVIVAGGKGLRMGGDLPKQYITVAGLPILMRTIQAFHQFDTDMQIILVLPADHQSYWQDLCNQYSFTVKHTMATGGETRFHSVSNGLSLTTGNLIAIHDGVRPFVSQEVIKRCFEEAEIHGSVVPVIEVVETIRQLDGSGSKTVNRDDYRLVQTPQVFQERIIKNAYQQSFNPFFTDDASVVEAMGSEIHLVEGNRENIKITTPYDLKISTALV